MCLPKKNHHHRVYADAITYTRTHHVAKLPKDYCDDKFDCCYCIIFTGTVFVLKSLLEHNMHEELIDMED